MESDDQVPEKVHINGTGPGPDWPGTAAVAREATLGRLRSLGLDPEPDRERGTAADLAKGAMRSVDDEAAHLIYDSELDSELVASVRAGSRNLRQLTFEAGDLVLELEVSSAGHLMGQVVPPQSAVVELRHRDGTASVETDDLGCFQVTSMPEGPVSFRWRTTGPAVQAVATSWITL
jgi:hypothetical protein